LITKEFAVLTTQDYDAMTTKQLTRDAQDFFDSQDYEAIEKLILSTGSELQ
jgi:hypothetical protein